MALITRPYTYTPGTVIDAAKVSSNETTIYNDFNGNITDANVLSLSESKVVFGATGHAHSGGVGGAPIQLVAGTSIASVAGAIAIPTDGNYFTLTGTNTVTGLGTRDSGVIAILRATSTAKLTHNGTSLILADAADFQMAAGDIICLLSEGSGNWRELWRRPAAFPAATQAQQETGTSVVVPVTPGRQQYHPSAAKWWVRFTPAGTIEGSYNVASLDDDGTADWGVNYTTAMSGATTYTALLSILGVINDLRILSWAFDALNTGSAEIVVVRTADNVAVETGVTSVLAAGFGDL